MTALKNNFIFLWLPVFLYAGLIFYLSSLSQLPGPYLFPQQDKIIHIIEYAVFGWLLARACKNTFRLSGGIFVFLVTILSLLYGLSDEFHQIFVPLRDPSIGDVFSDAAGGFLGCWAYHKNRLFKFNFLHE